MKTIFALLFSVLVASTNGFTTPRAFSPNRKASSLSMAMERTYIMVSVKIIEDLQVDSYHFSIWEIIERQFFAQSNDIFVRRIHSK